jgi:hypothetical protein
VVVSELLDEADSGDSKPSEAILEGGFQVKTLLDSIQRSAPEKAHINNNDHVSQVLLLY